MKFARCYRYFNRRIARVLNSIGEQSEPANVWNEYAGGEAIISYEGAQTCSLCHPKAASEIMKTTHWTWEYTDPESGQVLGKNNVINNYCIATASNEPRCTSCHVGVGYTDQTFDFSDSTKVDCLVCHDTTGTYKKIPTGAGAPFEDLNLTFIAQNAGLTSRQTCGACHFFGGGGDAVKHGDLDSTMFNPDRDLDVHMAVNGSNFQCTTCHQTDHHTIPGTRYPTQTTDDQLCVNCHGRDKPVHSEDQLNAHTARVACQTCHIPEFARGGKATKMFWDWTKAGEKNDEGGDKIVKDEDGNVIYHTKKGEFVWNENVVPEYLWFNGGVTYVTLDDVLTPNGVVTINQLQGALEDPKSRIFPVKRFAGIQPYDAGNGTLAIPHLFGADEEAYWKSYDWNRAMAAGMEYVGREFSGELGYIQTEMFWIQNHMVAPKEKALSCANCHVPGGRLNFLALGYDEERAALLEGLAQPETFRLILIDRGSTPGTFQISWKPTGGDRYQVQHSQDLSDWTNADGGQLVAGEVDSNLSWSDNAPPTGYRFYRVLRTSQ